MTTANLRITPDDWRDATVTCSVSPSSGFEVINTQNTIRGDVFRSPNTTTMTISATWAASRVASALYLFNHLLHGASIRTQIYSDAAWATPAVAFSDSGTVAALCYTTTTDGYTNSLGTKDPNKDSSPYWLYFAETTYRSVKLTISGTPSAVSYFQIGRILLGRYFGATAGPSFGFQLGESDTGNSTRTEGGSRRGYSGYSWPTMSFELNNIRPTERTFWRDFMRTNKRGTDFAVSVFPGDGTSRERDYTINGCFSSVDALNNESRRFTKRVQVEGV